MSVEDYIFVILRKEANKVKYSWCSCYGNIKNGEINLDDRIQFLIWDSFVDFTRNLENGAAPFDKIDINTKEGL